MSGKVLYIRGLFVDNDGVLLDSYPGAVATHIAMARQLRLRVPTPGQLRRAFGMQWESEMLPYLWPNDHLRFRKAYLAKHNGNLKVPTFPGLLDTLKDLRDCGMHLGVVTNRDRESTLRRWKEVGIKPRMFTVVTTSRDTPFRKPHPGAFEPALKKFAQAGVRRTDTALAGDTLIDYEAAQKLGIPFIGVATGPCTVDDFIAAGVPKRRIIESPWELIRIVRSPA